MTQFEEQFRSASHDIRITPSDQAWARLSDKLDAADSKRKLRKLKIVTFSVAAAILALVATTIAITVFSPYSAHTRYSASLTKLSASEMPDHQMYSAENVRYVNHQITQYVDRQ